MKKLTLLLAGIIFFFSFTTLNTGGDIPSVNVKTLEGKTVDIKDYIGKGNLTVLSFWATWCSPCKKELDAVNDLYPEWKEQYGVDFVAITIDNARALAKVPAMVSNKGWEYTILSDSNQDLQRVLNFQTIPQTFLLDGEGNIIYSHSGYSPGDEYELEDKIVEAAGK